MDLCTDNLHDIMIKYFKANNMIQVSKLTLILWAKEVVSLNRGGMNKEGKGSLYLIWDRLSKFLGNRAKDLGLLQEDVNWTECLKVKQVISREFSLVNSGLVVNIANPCMAGSHPWWASLWSKIRPSSIISWIYSVTERHCY